MKSIFLGVLDPMTRAESFAKTTKMFATDTLAVFVAGLVVCALTVAFILHLRRRKRRIVGGEKVFRPSHSDAGEEDASEEVRLRYKKRVRRRGHRHRNPTLAETGGLPGAKTHSEHDAA